MKKTRGSEWRKWDMHIHSPYSNLNNKYNCDVQKFCDTIIEKEISVIGLTNYFYISKEEYESVRDGLGDKCLVIPNYEFRINDKNKENEFINIHILFNPSIDIDKINECISELKLNNISSEKKVNCKPDNLKKYGYEAVTVSFDELTSKVDEHFHHRSEYLIVGVNRGYGGFFPDGKPRNIELAKKMDSYSDFIFSKQDDIDFFLNKGKHGKEREKLRLNPKPVVFCSDAHTINEIGEKFSWIKCDTTFEGFKQIMFEPSERIKIQEHKPDFKEEKLVIDYVKFTSSNNLFNTSPIYLNQNLNVIIGGKSSGKSILLYNIAKTLETNNEVSNIVSKDYDFKATDPDFDFEVVLTSGASQKMYDNENSIIPNIKYIPQNYLSKLAEPNEDKKSSEDLLKYVRGLLLEESKYNEKYNEFLSRVKLNDKYRNDIIDNFFGIKQYIKDKEKELKELGNEEALKRSVESNNKRIEELKKGLGLTDEQIKDYNAKKKQQDIVNSEISKLKEDYKRFLNFSKETRNSLAELRSKKELVEKSLNIDKVKNEFNSKFGFIEEKYIEIDGFIESIRISEAKFVNDNIFKAFFDEEFKKLNDLKKGLEVYQKNDKIKKEVSKLEATVSNDNRTLQKITKIKEEIQLNKEELQKEKNKLFKHYIDNHKEYPKIVNTLTERAKRAQDERLIIEGTVKFNSNKFNKRMRGISDNRSFPENNYALFTEKENLIVFDEVSHLNQIKKIFNEIIDQKFPLNSEFRKSPSSAVKVLLDDYFIDFWETIYDNDKMEKMSTGKASFVILMLIIGLSSSEVPILIDQPEDNLDNRSITKDLVEYIRNKKLERQIILVTHNPNVVVNADAENVIIAHQKGQNNKETSSIYTFDYINGGIENTKRLSKVEKNLLKSMGIREHIAEVVEGGKDAFQKREKKYGFR